MSPHPHELRPAYVNRRTGQITALFSSDTPDRCRAFVRAHQGCYSPVAVCVVLPAHLQLGAVAPRWEPIKGDTY